MIFTSTTPLWLGQVICIPPQCNTYIVQSGDTCDAIANRTSTSFQQLVAWNPSLGPYCTNLLSGQSICVSLPGGVQNLTTIAGATATQTGIYASTTSSRPDLIPSGTTLECGKYYQAQAARRYLPGNLAQSNHRPRAFRRDQSRNRLSLLKPRAWGLLLILPTENWNATVTSTVVPAPTTTPAGTNPNCYQYYVIQSGDYYALVKSKFDITMSQLQFWNAGLLSDYSNLALGEVYCVNGAVSLSSSTPPATSATATAAAKRDSLASPISVASVTMTNLPAGGLPYGWPGLRAANPARAYAAAMQKC